MCSDLNFGSSMNATSISLSSVNSSMKTRNLYNKWIGIPGNIYITYHCLHGCVAFQSSTFWLSTTSSWHWHSHTGATGRSERRMLINAIRKANEVDFNRSEGMRNKQHTDTHVLRGMRIALSLIWNVIETLEGAAKMREHVWLPWRFAIFQKLQFCSGQLVGNRARRLAQHDLDFFVYCFGIFTLRVVVPTSHSAWSWWAAYVLV